MLRASLSPEVAAKLKTLAAPAAYRIYDLAGELVASVDTTSAQQAVWQGMFAGDLSVNQTPDATHIVRFKPDRGAEYVVGYVIPSTRHMAPRPRKG